MGRQSLGRSILFSFTVLFLAGAGVQAKEIVIGVELPLTGAVAPWGGVPPRNGAELAMEEVNANHELGGDTLKLLIEDMASDKTQAITLTNQFIKRDNVALIIGPSTTPFAAAAAPIANEGKTPLIALAAADVITKTGPYIFKMISSAGPDIADLANFAIKKMDLKNYVSLYNRDNDAYVEYNTLMHEHLQKAGIPELAEESTLASETDFTALASKLVQLNPDSLFIGMVAEQAANIVIQARQAGMSDKVKIFGQGGGIFPQYAKIGGKAVDGTYFLTHYFVGLPTELNQRFLASYRAKYKADPDEFAVIGYSAVKIAVRAIRSAGSTDHDKIRDALANIKNVPTILGTGTFSFDETRAPVYGSVILQLKNGVPVLVE
jgi:branched-chain amino acid transport system substrate-binding protein